MRALLRAAGDGESLEARAREHLAECAACRELAARLDPAILFLELRGGTLPEGFWAGFRERLGARLPEARGFDWGALFRPPRLAYLAAPLAMLVILGTTALLMRPGLLAPARPGLPSPMRSPYDANPGVLATGRAAPHDAGAPAVGKIAGTAPDAGTAPPLLEEVGSPHARVYHFDVGGSGSEIPIYLVVDESIDI